MNNSAMFGHFVSWSITLLALGVVICKARPSARMPVTFKSLDEESTVHQVARWAAKELNIGYSDICLRYSLNLFLYSANLNWMGSIPISELVILRPFIERVIEGSGPPQNLPAEYDDPRPAVLVRFKSRMEAEGLWSAP